MRDLSPQSIPSASSTSSQGSSSLSVPSNNKSGQSSSAASGLSSSPHDRHRQPSGSILANAHEGPSRSEVKAKTSKRSAIKAAFIPAQPGRKIKTDGKPLGKTFERTTPLPANIKISGGQVLEHDPRGDVGAGDGIVLSPSREYDEDESALIADDEDSKNEKGLPPTGPSSYSSSASASDSSNRRGRHRTDTMSTQHSSITSDSSSSHAASIRFAPLPVSGRLKRANSIAIGVAARSQLLRSQGPGRNSMFPPQPAQPPLPHGMSRQQYYASHQHPQGSNVGSGGGGGGAGAGDVNATTQGQATNGGQSSSNRPSQTAWYNGGNRPEDVVDLGEEISKRCKSAWKRMRGNGASQADTDSTTPTAKAAATPTGRDEMSPQTANGGAAPSGISAATRASIEDTGGEKTPRRRPASPSDASSLSEGVSKMDIGDDVQTQGSHRDHFPAHHHPHSAAHEQHDEGEGSRTPRQGVTRRLSTGAFLGNASLREMQEERRRGFVGVDASAADGDDDPSAEQAHHHRHGDAAAAATLPDQEEESLAASLRQSLGRTGAGTVLGRLAPWSMSGGDDKSHGIEGASRGGQEGRGGRGGSSSSVVVNPQNPEEEEFGNTSEASSRGEDEDDDDDDEEMQEAERLAEQSFAAGSQGKAGKAGGIEIVHRG